eukprot:Amastigsp_a2152_319.p2 type:complete len:414 gc:universal Amastigsp_a2152_319:1-1242(+)
MGTVLSSHLSWIMAAPPGPSIDVSGDHSHPHKTTFHLRHKGENVDMVVDSRYRVDKILGKGAYGVVAQGMDLQTKTPVAIKKLIGIFDHPLSAKRALRELKIQCFLQHENILKIHDIMTIDPAERLTFDDLYLVIDLMKVDLNYIMKQELTPDHHKFFMYQLLKALKYLHSAGCLHRDLKPANCLTNADCFLKVCDFGLAKQEITPSYAAVVVTRYYRAPELFLDPFSYSSSIDIWSAGLILAEFLHKDVWLQAPTDALQLQMLLETFGPPPADLVDKYHYAKAKSYVQNFKFPPRKSLAEHFPGADADLLDLLGKMLDMDWRTRISAADALAHPAFAGIRAADSEVVETRTLPTFDFESRDELPVEITRALIYNEMLRMHGDLGTYDPDAYLHHFSAVGAEDWDFDPSAGSA